MSEAQSALSGARFDGDVTITEGGLQGMITLRGDLAAPGIKNAATGVAGVDFPGVRQFAGVGPRGIGWMSPDELLILLPYAEAATAVQTMGASLQGDHHLVADVSDARALFRIEGPRAREVLAKLCPVDFAPDAFGPGDLRRTRAAQAAVAIWMRDDGTFELVCFRSVARYVFDLLSDAAHPTGVVGYFPADGDG